MCNTNSLMNGQIQRSGTRCNVGYTCIWTHKVQMGTLVVIHQIDLSIIFGID